MLQQRGADLAAVARGRRGRGQLRAAAQRAPGGAPNRLTYGQWSQPAEVLATTGAPPGRRLRRAGAAGRARRRRRRGARPAATSRSPHPTAAPSPRTAPGPSDVDDLPDDGVRRPGRRALLGAPARCASPTASLLVDLARQLGTVVHAAGLLETIRAARERLVLAREEERRRLRRDLHDGLGPALAGLTLQVDTVRNQVGGRADETAARTARAASRRRCSTCAGSSRVSDRRRWTTSGWARRSGELADGFPTCRSPSSPTTCPAAGGGRGGGVPDRPGGAGQRRPARPRPPRVRAGAPVPAASWSSRSATTARCRWCPPGRGRPRLDARAGPRRSAVRSTWSRARDAGTTVTARLPLDAGAAR